jgi:hypothetical protein
MFFEKKNFLGKLMLMVNYQWQRAKVDADSVIFFLKKKI